MRHHPVPSVSVVVASRGRPGWLARCLTGLGQLEYPNFEIVVVADPASLDALAKHALYPALKALDFDAQNISEARNAGIAAAGGAWVAFIDDDAVPEPTWLCHHMRAAAALGAVATVGFVRGRNGISYQTTVNSVDSQGETHNEFAGDGGAFVPKLRKGRALKLVGTNTVVRRENLLALGGFDPAYRFYLDDSDFSLRLALAGGRAGVAPLAQVHHSFAPSVRRTSLRAPLDLTEIGRSMAIFAHRWRGAPPDELKARLFAREKCRLVRHMVLGTCEPRDVAFRMRTLERGWREGAVLSPAPPAPISSKAAFSPVPDRPHGHRLISSRFLRRRSAVARAARYVETGGRASVFSFSLTPVRHRVRFLHPGIWVQTGGQFGRSRRSGRWWQWCTFADRLSREVARVALIRGIGENAASPDTDEERLRARGAIAPWGREQVAE